MWLKTENKDKIAELRQAYSDKKVDLDTLPADVLAELLWKAILRIDEKENGGEFDERDAMDCLCDEEYIVDELFESIEQSASYGVYDKGE